jgi:hypothetical protein
MSLDPSRAQIVTAPSDRFRANEKQIVAALRAAAATVPWARG